jgi:hypothetical protein
MKITEAQARDIAWVFAQEDAEYRRFPLRPHPRKATMESHGIGQKILGCTGEFWAFVFEMDVPKNTIVHPNFVLVLVDPETSKADYLPLK